MEPVDSDARNAEGVINPQLKTLSKGIARPDAYRAAPVVAARKNRAYGAASRKPTSAIVAPGPLRPLLFLDKERTFLAQVQSVSFEQHLHTGMVCASGAGKYDM